MASLAKSRAVPSASSTIGIIPGGAFGRGTLGSDYMERSRDHKLMRYGMTDDALNPILWMSHKAVADSVGLRHKTLKIPM
jgi:hypothetical protein